MVLRRQAVSFLAVATLLMAAVAATQRADQVKGLSHGNSVLVENMQDGGVWSKTRGSGTGSTRVVGDVADAGNGGGGVSQGLTDQVEEFQEFLESWTRVIEGETDPNLTPNPNSNPRNNVGGGVSSGGGGGGYLGGAEEKGSLRGRARPGSEVLGQDRDVGLLQREEEGGGGEQMEEQEMKGAGKEEGAEVEEAEFQGLGGFVEDLSAGVLGEEEEEAHWASQYSGYSSDSAAKKVAREKIKGDLASEMWWEAVGTRGWGGVAGILENGGGSAVGRAFASFLLREYLKQRPGRGGVLGDASSR